MQFTRAILPLRVVSPGNRNLVRCILLLYPPTINGRVSTTVNGVHDAAFARKSDVPVSPVVNRMTLCMVAVPVAASECGCPAIAIDLPASPTRNEVALFGHSPKQRRSSNATDLPL